MNTGCPDLEDLFIGLDEGEPAARGHVEICALCASIVEEHRQLEKDLLRIADPLPPPDFVHTVMAKVDAQPVPVPVRRELWTAAGILTAALLGVLLIFVVDASAAAQVGSAMGSAVLSMRNAAVGASRGLSTLWETSALPVTAVASVLLVLFLFGLRNVASDHRVNS